MSVTVVVLMSGPKRNSDVEDKGKRNKLANAIHSSFKTWTHNSLPLFLLGVRSISLPCASS